MNRRMLSKQVNVPSESEEKVFWNLRRYGAPLTHEGKPGPVLSPEESLARALALSRRFPHVAMVWPVLFARNADHLDWDVLESYAREFDEGAALGFYMGLLHSLTGDDAFLELESRVADTRGKTPENFFRFRHSPMMLEHARRLTSEEARRWNFWMAVPLQDFRETWETFTRGS